MKILHAVVPGQEWAHRSLCFHFTSCLVHVLHRLAQHRMALVVSFYAVAPSGAGKSFLGRRMVVRLAALGVPTFVYHISAHNRSGNPGRTVERELAAFFRECMVKYAAMLAENPHLLYPFVEIIVDELDHATWKLSQCFRAVLDRDDPHIEIRDSKTDAVTVLELPNGWAFMFIWMPNAAGDRLLLEQPSPSQPNKHASDWQAVSTAVRRPLLQHGSIVRRVMTHKGELDSIVLLYRLQGEAKAERCLIALDDAWAKYRRESNVTLHWAFKSEYVLASWSEENMPIFTQLANALQRRIGHLCDIAVEVCLFSDRSVTISALDHDAQAQEELDALLAEMQPDAVPAVASFPGVGGQGSQDLNDAPGDPEYANAAEPESDEGVHESKPHGMPSGSMSPLMISSAATPAVVPDVEFWKRHGVSIVGRCWFPVSTMAIEEVYACSGARLPHNVKRLRDNLRKQLSQARLPIASRLVPDQVGISGTARWYPVEDVHRVWDKIVANSSEVAAKSPMSVSSGRSNSLASGGWAYADRADVLHPQRQCASLEVIEPGDEDCDEVVDGAQASARAPAQHHHWAMNPMPYSALSFGSSVSGLSHPFAVSQPTPSTLVHRATVVSSHGGRRKQPNVRTSKQALPTVRAVGYSRPVITRMAIPVMPPRQPPLPPIVPHQSVQQVEANMRAAMALYMQQPLAIWNSLPK